MARGQGHPTRVTCGRDDARVGACVAATGGPSGAANAVKFAAISVVWGDRKTTPAVVGGCDDSGWPGATTTSPPPLDDTVEGRRWVGAAAAPVVVAKVCNAEHTRPEAFPRLANVSSRSPDISRVVMAPELRVTAGCTDEEATPPPPTDVAKCDDAIGACVGKPASVERCMAIRVAAAAAPSANCDRLSVSNDARSDRSLPGGNTTVLAEGREMAVRPLMAPGAREGRRSGMLSAVTDSSNAAANAESRTASGWDLLALGDEVAPPAAEEEMPWSLPPPPRDRGLLIKQRNPNAALKLR